MKIYVGTPFQQLTLYENTQIPSIFNNPFFSNEGSFSFETTVPAEGNSHIYGYPQSPASLQKIYKELPAKIDVNSRTINCSCQITRADEKDLSIKFYFEESPFFRTIKNKKITDVKFPDINLPHPKYSVAAYHDEDGFQIEGQLSYWNREGDFDSEKRDYLLQNLNIISNNDIFTTFNDTYNDHAGTNALNISNRIRLKNNISFHGILFHIDTTAFPYEFRYPESTHYNMSKISHCLFLERIDTNDNSRQLTVISDITQFNKTVFIPSSYFPDLNNEDIIYTFRIAPANYLSVFDEGYDFSEDSIVNYYPPAIEPNAITFSVKNFVMAVIEDYPYLPCRSLEVPDTGDNINPFDQICVFILTNYKHLNEENRYNSFLQNIANYTVRDYMEHEGFPYPFQWDIFQWFTRARNTDEGEQTGPPAWNLYKPYFINAAYIGNPIPSFYLKYIIDHISNFTGYEIVYPQHILDFDKIVLFGFTSLLNFEFFQNVEQGLYHSKFNAAKMLPAKPIIELINAVAKATGSYIVVSDIEKKLYFKPYKEKLLSNKYIDVSSDFISQQFLHGEKLIGYLINYEGHPDDYFFEKYKSLIDVNYKGKTSSLPAGSNEYNDCYLVQASGNSELDNTYQRWNGISWTFHSLYPALELSHNPDAKNIYRYNFELFPVINGKTKAFSQFDIELEWVNPSYSGFNEIVIPITKIKVACIYDYSIALNLQKEIPFCYSIFHGAFQNDDTLAGNYLFGSCDIYYPDGNEITGAYFNMQIIADRGMYERFLKDYIYYIMHKNDKYSVKLLPAMDLVFYKDKIQINGNRFLIENMEFVLTNEGMSAINLEARQTD